MERRAQNLIGTIAEVNGPVVDVACERLPPLHRALQADTGGKRYTFEVYRYIDRHHVRAIALQNTAGLQRGNLVFDTEAPLSVPVAPNCLGRLLNMLGEPLVGLRGHRGADSGGARAVA